MENSRFRNWIKRFGVAGFLFFLLKGLFYLFAGAWLLERCSS